MDNLATTLFLIGVIIAAIILARWLRATRAADAPPASRHEFADGEEGTPSRSPRA